MTTGEYVDKHEPSAWLIGYFNSHGLVEQCQHIAYTHPVDRMWASLHGDAVLCATCLDEDRSESVCDRCGEPFTCMSFFDCFMDTRTSGDSVRLSTSATIAASERMAPAIPAGCSPSRTT